MERVQSRSAFQHGQHLRTAITDHVLCEVEVEGEEAWGGLQLRQGVCTDIPNFIQLKV